MILNGQGRMVEFYNIIECHIDAILMNELRLLFIGNAGANISLIRLKRKPLINKILLIKRIIHRILKLFYA
jgi:hypothetical protein